MTSYTIEYRASGGSVYTSISTPASPLESVLTDLSPYTLYDVRVRAVNMAGQGEPSTDFAPAVQTHPDAPAMPSNLMFTSVSPPTITVSWGVPSPANGEVAVYEILVTAANSPNAIIDRTLYGGATQTTVSSKLSTVIFT